MGGNAEAPAPPAPFCCSETSARNRLPAGSLPPAPRTQLCGYFRHATQDVPAPGKEPPALGLCRHAVMNPGQKQEAGEGSWPAEEAAGPWPFLLRPGGSLRGSLQRWLCIGHAQLHPPDFQCPRAGSGQQFRLARQAKPAGAHLRHRRARSLLTLRAPASCSDGAISARPPRSDAFSFPGSGGLVRCRTVKLDMKMLVSSFCLPHSSSVPTWVIIFLFGFHVHKLDSAHFRVLGPEDPVTAVVGEDVMLPCHLSPRLNAENMEVRWFRSRFSVYVHLYHSGQDHYSSQMPEYQERTEFSKEGISAGNVSLRILRVRLTDEGQYQCLVKDGSSYEEAMVELKVAVAGSSPLLSVEDYQDGGIRVGCRATGWYPKPEMLWRDSQGQQFPSFTESDSQDKKGYFEVEKSIIIQKNSKRNMSCSIRNTQLNQEKESTIYISDPIFPEVSPWIVGLAATLAACFALFIVLLVFILRLQARHAAELEKRDAEIKKHAAELRWRNTIIPVEEVHVTLDADTAHPQLILSADGKSVRRGDTRQAMPDNPERFDTYHCILGQEGFVSGRYFWEVDVGTAEGGVWAMGVARDSMKRKGWINPAPQDGILAIFQCGGQYWALTSPDHKPLLLTHIPQRIRVYLDFEGEKVAFFNADNEDLLFIFPLAPLSGERIRPWFRVGPIAQLSLKSAPPLPRAPSTEKLLLPSHLPLQSLSEVLDGPCTSGSRK